MFERVAEYADVKIYRKNLKTIIFSESFHSFFRRSNKSSSIIYKSDGQNLLSYIGMNTVDILIESTVETAL